MCGIVYEHNLQGEDVTHSVWEQYEKQKARGTEGFGVFNGKYTTKASMEKRMKRWFKNKKNASEMVLFHHRFPTSTINVKRAAHPFNTGDYFGDTKYVLVHNGVVRNPKDLRTAHEALGIEYQSVLQDGKFNDSEALLWDVALTMEGEQDDLKAYGGIAFICIKLENNVATKMYFGRNLGRPLKLERTTDTVKLSSEGAGEEIEPSRLFTYNYQLNRLTSKYFRVPSYDPDVKYNWDAKKAYVPMSNERVITNNYPTYSNAEDRRWLDSHRDGDNYVINEEGYAEYIDDDYDDYDYHTSRADSVVQSIGEVIEDRNKVEVGEVNSAYFRVLADNIGLYHDAYVQIQVEYDQLAELDFHTSAELHEMRVLTEAAELIFDDPDYTDEQSIHTMWEWQHEQRANNACMQQQSLVGATA